MGVEARARRGDSRSWSYLYWNWIRHIALEEGVALPQSGTTNELIPEDMAKNLASALRTRADKIRRGLAPRDATGYIQQMDKKWFPTNDDRGNTGSMNADFDDPVSMDQTADFFDSSGGVTLVY